MKAKMIPVTKPFLPPLSDVLPFLERIWDSKILSNNGPIHQELEQALAEFLGLEHVSLFCNATVALIAAQQALGIQGEVITTPYTFVATAHSIHWMGNSPVFADIDPVSLTLDPGAVESAITESTSAIMPLHCYGNTCATDELKTIADRYGLKIIYDACHSFGVSDSGGSVLRHGDISVVSFHATKVFNTFEGGLLVSSSAELKEKVDNLKNFGFLDETIVVEAGINGKMSEFNAAVGLAQLKYSSEIFTKRGAIDATYRKRLSQVRGLRCLEPVGQVTKNYAYFPIFVGEDYSLSRDALYQALRDKGIYCRRYFYPLVSEFEMYRDIPSGRTEGLPIAAKISRSVICLPLFPDLHLEEVHSICDIIVGCGAA